MVPTAIDLGTALTSAATAITTQVGDALPVALPVAGAILAVGIGWKIFKRFVRG
jgi:phage protein D